MITLSLAGIALISLLAQWLAWSVRVPAILFLLLSGLLLGPVTGVLDPDQLLGELLFPLVSLSVAIILFEGALTLHLTELKGIGKVVRNLCSTGMLVSFAVIGAASYWLLGLDWRVAMVLGAVLVGAAGAAGAAVSTVSGRAALWGLSLPAASVSVVVN